MSSESQGPARGPAARRVPCVGAVIRDDAGRLLLVRRGRAPAVGRWSLPGGRVEPGETPESALVREVAEETGLRVEVGRRLGTVEWPGNAGVLYAITDHECTLRGGVLRAGDDASDVAWYDVGALAELPLTDSLLEVLEDWGVLRTG